MSTVKNVGKDLGKVVLDSVELKINFATLFNGIIDNVIEKAIDEVVAATDTKFDDQAKALLWPILEPKIKELLEKEANKLQTLLDSKLQEIKDSVVSKEV